MQFHIKTDITLDLQDSLCWIGLSLILGFLQGIAHTGLCTPLFLVLYWWPKQQPQNCYSTCSVLSLMITLQGIILTGAHVDTLYSSSFHTFELSRWLGFPPLSLAIIAL